MKHELSPEIRHPSQRAIELAGALQGVAGSTEEKDFYLDYHQKLAIDAIGSELMDGKQTGYLEAATGSGKTLLIALLAEAAVQAGQRVHILAPSITIGDQLVGADGEKGLGRFTGLIDKKAVRQNYGGKRGNDKAPVVVSTYSGLLNEARAFENGESRLGKFDLILGDECHESLGTETSMALYRYMPDAIKVGFSATPDYAEDRLSSEIYGDPWFEFSLRTAIESGVAAPVRPLLFATDSTLEIVDNRKDYTERELAPLIGNMERNGLALQMAQDFVADGRQGIVACIPGGGNAHAALMAQLLSKSEANGRAVVAADVGSHLDRAEQQQRLRAFRNGEIDILTFTRAIEQGWDSDRASFCLNLAPSTSPVRIKQLLGRIIRPKEDGRESIFVDFVDDKSGIDKPRQYTSFHALELEDIELDRVLGWGGSKGGVRATPKKLVTQLRPELYERLMRLQGQLLSETTVNKSSGAIDPIVAQWERRLTKEGMPRELPYNVAFTPKLAGYYAQAVDALQRQIGDVPSNDEVADFLKTKITQEQQRVIRLFGQRALFSEVEATAETLRDDRESTEETLARYALKGVLGTTLSTLSEREVGVVSLRFGIGRPDGEGLTLDATGKVYNVTRERVRAIESQALSKLRHPSRSDVLRGFLAGEDEKSATKTIDQSKLKQEATPALFSITREYDSSDDETYGVRLRRANQERTQRQLEVRIDELDEWAEAYRESKNFAWAYHELLCKKLLLTVRQIKPLEAAQRRTAERPLHPKSQGSRDASLDTFTTSIQMLKVYANEIRRRINEHSGSSV